MSYTLHLKPDTIVRQSKTVLDMPMECLVGRHQGLRFGYNHLLGIPIIICTSCGENLTENILDGTKSKREVALIEKRARARRTTPPEILDRLALTNEEDRIKDPILRKLVEDRIKRLERSRSG